MPYDIRGQYPVKIGIRNAGPMCWSTFGRWERSPTHSLLAISPTQWRVCWSLGQYEKRRQFHGHVLYVRFFGNETSVNLMGQQHVFILFFFFFFNKCSLLSMRFIALTDWGRETHICVGNLTIISTDVGLSPGRRQAIIWTNTGLLLIGPLWTYFSEF